MHPEGRVMAKGFSPFSFICSSSTLWQELGKIPLSLDSHRREGEWYVTGTAGQIFSLDLLRLCTLREALQLV